MIVNSTLYQAAVERAERYAIKRNLEIIDKLGSGLDGVVFGTKQQTAIKAAFYQEVYAKELKVYRRLLERNIESICGFSVPRLTNHDDGLWIIEMQIVTAPFVVDFVAGYVDVPPDYPTEDLERAELEQEEKFEGHWPEVQRVLAGFRCHGIYLMDIHPGNINFGKEGTERA